MIERESVKVTVPAKCILFGEYAVVEGWPAIAFSISQYVTTAVVNESDELIYEGDSKDIVLALMKHFNVKALLKIESNIPMGVGLGSSAVFLVAVISALSRFSNTPVDVFKVAREWEHKLHNGKSSGLDIAICIAGMNDLTQSVMIRYQRGEWNVLDIKAPSICIYDSGIPRSKTPVKWDSEALAQLGKLADRFTDNADSLSSLFDIANDCLDVLGVVPSELKVIKNSAWKMTGAGKGGCFITLYNLTCLPLTNTRLIWRSSPL